MFLLVKFCLDIFGIVENMVKVMAISEVIIRRSMGRIYFRFFLKLVGLIEKFVDFVVIRIDSIKVLILMIILVLLLVIEFRLMWLWRVIW